ncbi:MAG: hypothetical protein G5703_12130 [Serratia symbiotica]|nr:hypothetical protein [Serratia symbiotica]
MWRVLLAQGAFTLLLAKLFTGINGRWLLSRGADGVAAIIEEEKANKPPERVENTAFI